MHLPTPPTLFTDAFAQIERTLFVELREMARFQPPRFVDLHRAVETLCACTDMDDDMDDEQYTLMHTASLLQRLIYAMPPKVVANAIRQAELNKVSQS